MADFCALCRNKLSFLGAKSMICCNEELDLCASCYSTLYNMTDTLERGRYVLAHGSPEHSEAIRTFIEKAEAEQARKAALEPPTRPCPNCGGEMSFKLKDFRIGADGNGGFYLLGGYEQYSVDLYACPDCGKVELYTSDFAAVKRNAEQKAKKDAEKKAAAEADLRAMEQHMEREYTPYRPGRKPGEKPPWEK